MRRIFWFLIGFLLATLLVVKCADASGWVAADEDGYVWEYRGRLGNTEIVLARCEYMFIRWNGIEKWKGWYYMKTQDFNGEGFDDRFVDNRNLDGLCGCVNWVAHQMYGDYYI